MTPFSGWMAGRKTYLVAGGVFLVVSGMVFLGRLTPDVASAIGLFAAAGFAVTFRAALAHHQAEVVQILERIAEAGVAARTNNRPAALSDLVQAAEQGASLADAVSKESKS